MLKLPLVMDGVREYCEKMEVSLDKNNTGRFIVIAENEGGHNATKVDVLDLLRWLKNNQSQIWNEV